MTAPLSRARANLLLLAIAVVWGSAFVAQSLGTRRLGPLAFTGLRFLLGAAVVAPFAWREWRALGASGRAPGRRAVGHVLALGTLLFLGAALQQLGIGATTVTNAGFLTALYIPLVPLVAWTLLRQAPHWTIWPAAAGCVAGTWLLAGGRGAGLAALNAGDLWVVASAVPWALHVLLVGHAANRLHGPALLASGQFLVCGVLGCIAALVLETVDAGAVPGALWAIAYTGVLSVGVGFTLQVVALRTARPADAAVVLSSETVWAALFGALFLGERLGPDGIAGCALILAGVLVVQLQPVVWAALKRR